MQRPRARRAAHWVREAGHAPGALPRSRSPWSRRGPAPEEPIWAMSRSRESARPVLCSESLTPRPDEAELDACWYVAWCITPDAISLAPPPDDRSGRRAQRRIRCCTQYARVRSGRIIEVLVRIALQSI